MDALNYLNENDANSTNNRTFIFDDFDGYADCVAAETVEFLQFFRCLKYFLSKSILVSSLVLIFAFSTAILNIVVIIFINRLKRYKTVFDKIFIGHALVDFLVGLLVIPNYCIYTMFGYWPLGKVLCHFYVSLDYTLCHCGILHMVFIAYARLRSLLSPKRYHQEFIISNAKTTMFGLWIISGLLWLPSVNLIINIRFEKRECYFTFDPVYIIIQDTIAYLTPMFIILGITCFILQTLHKTNKRRRQIRKKKQRKKDRTKALMQANQSVVVGSNNSNNNNNKNMTSNDVLNQSITHHHNHAISPYNYTIVPLKDIDRSSLSDVSTTNSDTLEENRLQSIMALANFTINSLKNPDFKIKNTELAQLRSQYSENSNEKQPIKSPSTLSTSTTTPAATAAAVAASTQKQTIITEKSPSMLRINKPLRPEYKVSIGPSTTESSCGGKSFQSARSIEADIEKNNGNFTKVKAKLISSKFNFKLNAFAKLYVIIATFCLLWLPFCILWPINSICPTCISNIVYQTSYWMGYAQSLINPILLLILNPNYNKLKTDN